MLLEAKGGGGKGKGCVYESVPKMHAENQESGILLILNGNTRDCFEEENRGKKTKPEGESEEETHNVLGNTAPPPRQIRYPRRPQDSRPESAAAATEATSETARVSLGCVAGVMQGYGKGTARVVNVSSTKRKGNLLLVWQQHRATPSRRWGWREEDLCSRVGRPPAGPGLAITKAPNSIQSHRCSWRASRV